MGGSMRLGAYEASLKKGTSVSFRQVIKPFMKYKTAREIRAGM
jgi:hypothetical protein